MSDEHPHRGHEKLLVMYIKPSSLEIITVLVDICSRHPHFFRYHSQIKV